MMAQAKATRDGFGEALLELARKDENIVALSGDLEDSTRAEYLKKEFPERFISVGISEQDMVGTAAGLALAGKIPFACSFSVFLTNRAYDQIRISVCYNNANVKLVGTHAGITVGPDGATAQSLEDIAIMRALPNMAVVVPADALEARKAAFALAKYRGPAYLRLGRSAVPVITADADKFELGKANVLKRGKDVTIIACGVMVKEALDALDMLAKENMSATLLNVHTIKPLDAKAIIEAARETGAVVTCEEHQVAGGLGGAVAETLAQNCPVPLKIVGVEDTFGESGEPQELLKKYGLTADSIAKAAKQVLKLKR